MCTAHVDDIQIYYNRIHIMALKSLPRSKTMESIIEDFQSKLSYRLDIPQWVTKT